MARKESAEAKLLYEFGKILKQANGNSWVTQYVTWILQRGEEFPKTHTEDIVHLGTLPNDAETHLLYAFNFRWFFAKHVAVDVYTITSDINFGETAEAILERIHRDSLKQRINAVLTIVINKLEEKLTSVKQNQALLQQL
jgi:hypothetical protein